VLKCSHNSGGVIVCQDKANFDVKAAVRSLKRQMNKKLLFIGPRMVVSRDSAARALRGVYGGPGGALPDDYKFLFVLTGCPRGLRLHHRKRKTCGLITFSTGSSTASPSTRRRPKLPKTSFLQSGAF
jgi:hypothetical protein